MITLIAKITAKPGKEAELAEECIKMAKEVNAKEKGCTMYIPHVSDDNPAEILFVEKYSDLEAYNNHFETPHFKALIEKFEVLLDCPPELQMYKELL